LPCAICTGPFKNQLKQADNKKGEIMSRPSMSKENCELLNCAIDDIDLPRDEAISKILLNHEIRDMLDSRILMRDRIIDEISSSNASVMAEYDREISTVKSKLIFYRVYCVALIVLSAVLWFFGGVV
tara:strand:+ start:547 stop:927 length:381 start_codon:yes stop_codon:yes gene_type:complete